MDGTGAVDRDQRYERLRRAIAGERLPCAVVDLGAFDRNVERCLGRVRGSGKTLRPATKSLRVPDLIRRVLERGGADCRGLLAYDAQEAAWLAARGFDDILVAYPTVQEADLRAVGEAVVAGRRVRLVVDSEAHLDAIAAAAGAAVGTGAAAGGPPPTFEVVVELDVSYRPLGGALHLGVRRSPLRTKEAVVALFGAARARPGIEPVGILAYEAFVAGLADDSPLGATLAPAVRWLKRRAAEAAARLRAETAAAVRAAGFTLALVNGGGTGSLAGTVRDPAVTEVTAGSAFLAPHLFDGYGGLGYEPAAFFACPVARASDPGLVTCQGGGFAASGAAGPDRAPRPWLPAGLELLRHEGAGEVQTPLATGRCAVALRPGDPVFFRHAKAGEPASHFDEYLLVADDRVVGRARTYRGCGLAFG